MKDNKPKKSARGHKAMIIIGIILLNISIFLAAFVFSFEMIMHPMENRDKEIQTLTEENEKLTNDSQLLRDQLDVVQSELDNYKKRSGSGSSDVSGRRSSDEDSGSDEDADRSERSERSETSERSSSGDREINMDNE